MWFPLAILCLLAVGVHSSGHAVSYVSRSDNIHHGHDHHAAPYYGHHGYVSHAYDHGHVHAPVHVPVPAPVHAPAHGHGHHHADHYPVYNYAYHVVDPHTGDIKYQFESRHGDHVSGKYQLLQPDGHTRHVNYNADDHHGFNALVQYKTAHVPSHHHGSDHSHHGH